MLLSLVSARRKTSHTQFSFIFRQKQKAKQKKNKNVIHRLRSVRIGKNCALGLEYGPRPAASGRTQDLGHSFFLHGPPSRWITYIYYMASSASGQGEAKSVFWLATRASKKGRYCPLGIARLVPAIKFGRSPSGCKFFFLFLRNNFRGSKKSFRDFPVGRKTEKTENVNENESKENKTSLLHITGFLFSARN